MPVVSIVFDRHRLDHQYDFRLRRPRVHKKALGLLLKRVVGMKSYLIMVPRLNLDMIMCMMMFVSSIFRGTVAMYDVHDVER